MSNQTLAFAVALCALVGVLAWRQHLILAGFVFFFGLCFLSELVGK